MPAHKKASGVHTEALLAKHVLRGTASGYAVAHHIPKRLDVFRKNIPHLIDAEPCRECCPRIDGVHPDATSGQTFRNTASARLLWNQLVTSMTERGCEASSAFLVRTAFSYVLRDWLSQAASGTPAMPSRRTISPPSPEPVTKTFGATPIDTAPPRRLRAARIHLRALQ